MAMLQSGQTMVFLMLVRGLTVGVHARPPLKGLLDGSTLLRRCKEDFDPSGLGDVIMVPARFRLPEGRALN
eukprot:CAMPEP_0171121488 /NCGR_PEP_ID=MMETSP0766_2-20121228/102634_1 /TAXON_ID=439317 /ORGANISM="Gambierdiscus australes, Strain CAWD 149" /LENGTH=70 /DNA_ID=CAMNT_0011584273 /DNA_START=145 /DNA_END=354 /DNA_ORIENTATION=+